MLSAVFVVPALLALQPGLPMPSRRAVLAAAPLAASSSAAHALNPLDILFGWIPEVGCSSGDSACNSAAKSPDAAAAEQPQELSMAEKIRRRRKELEDEEEQKLLREYQMNRQASAASMRTDDSGR